MTSGRPPARSSRTTRWSATSCSWWTEDGDRLVGYWIGKPFWGRGIATAALEAYLAEEKTRPLRARVSDRNRGSIRVLEKCGFRPVAREDGGEGVVDLVYELKA